jgi:hypothetical protein
MVLKLELNENMENWTQYVSCVVGTEFLNII